MVVGGKRRHNRTPSVIHLLLLQPRHDAASTRMHAFIQVCAFYLEGRYDDAVCKIVLRCCAMALIALSVMFCIVP